MPPLESLALLTLGTGLAAVPSRILTWHVLRKRGLLERFGDPRRTFFSDLLALRCLSSSRAA
jgi:hypothetical protein